MALAAIFPPGPNNPPIFSGLSVRAPTICVKVIGSRPT